MSEIIVTYVKAGETLSEIAVRYGVSVDALQRWNRIEDPDLVLAGQRIIVHNTADTTTPSVLEGLESRTTSDSPIVGGYWDILIGGAISLGVILLLLLLRRKRRNVSPISRIPSTSQPQPVSPRGTPFSGGQNNTLRYPRPSSSSSSLPRPPVNDGERLVSSKLIRYYPQWILINDILVPSGLGTAQIDHILIAPSVVFLIETKDMKGWVFGSPGQKNWTQTYVADRWSCAAGIKSNKFKFYNPLMQNEGHARALLNLGVVDRFRLRPIVVFVGNAEMKTADNFLQFDEHEKIARRDIRWRMRGVICMSLAEMHRYIKFSTDNSQNPRLTREQMEFTREKIRKKEIPVTAESRAKHAAYVRSAQDSSSR